MRAQDKFDICHDRYCNMRNWLEGRPLSAPSGRLDAASTEYLWKPARARAAEYVADFDLAARRVLGRPQWKGRRRLFEIYYVRRVEYRRAIALVGVSSRTFDWWTEEIRRIVGQELGRAGVFPPGKYFCQPSANRRKEAVEANGARNAMETPSLAGTIAGD